MNKKALMSGIFSAVLVVLVVFVGASYYYDVYEKEDVPQTVVNSDVEIIEDVIVTERIDVEYEKKDEETSKNQEVVITKKFIKPLSNGKVVRKFFDLNNSDEEKLNSIVEYEGVYRPSIAVSYSDNNQASKVIAVCDGLVKSVSVDNLLGNRVIVEYDDYTIIYYSIDHVVVKDGQYIKQGEQIGVCAENAYDGDLGKHVSISVMCNNEYVDFEKMLGL